MSSRMMMMSAMTPPPMRMGRLLSVAASYPVRASDKRVAR
jgi:hypothetical protein